ncbi:MAG: aminodeoxychorismate/anthranilate synthase component II [Gammaproteobacteria bacterium]|nr:aminodeoxychorismate/anthranilate synthase component II [Gammaproteobacteria bacterium]
MLLMIDNYDSFTYNLVHYFRELHFEVLVVKNDAISISQITALQPRAIVISPGPGSPDQAGISLEVIKSFAGAIPLLGVCLGHQSIGQAFGGQVTRSHKVMHGKISKIYHCGEGIFRNLPNPFNATRYHSLVVDKNSLPSCFAITAWTQNERGDLDEIMGLKHAHFLIEGVQFHPESILTEHGKELLQNFLTTERDRQDLKTL